jgi:alpha-L-rhamnosidase
MSICALAISALTAAPTVPLLVTPVEPLSVERRGNVWFADFGKAAFGNLRVSFKAGAPAAEMTVRFGEKLGKDGRIDRKPPGSVNFREIRMGTPGGAGDFQPTIPGKPFHNGAASVKMPASIGEVTPFRYVEIENCPVTLDKSSLRLLVAHAPFDRSASAFECSDPTLNAVWDLCKYTMEATTAFGIYIDGERERIPYEGDAYINLLSHYACDLDPRVARATFVHLLAQPTWPTEWSLQMPMIAHADYEATGDPVLAAEHFEKIKSKLLLGKAREDGLLRVTAIVDWPAAERDGYNDGKIDPKERRQIGPEINTVANAFHYRALRCTAELATAIGKTGDAADLTARADKLRKAFDTVFFDKTRGIYIDGEGSSHASLHANMFPLAFGLVPADRVKSVSAFVRSRGMACSVYGAQFLLDALYQSGGSDHALSLMTSRSDRSWWHMIEQGSTMTLEAWNASAKPNLTWNHAWGGAPANIITRHLLGVRPLRPGYASILIAPQPAGLKSMRGKVPTPKGPVLVTVKNEGPFGLEIEIPPATTARVVLPGPAHPAAKVTLDGKPYRPAVENGSHVIPDLTPGRHRIVRRQP